MALKRHSDPRARLWTYPLARLLTPQALEDTLDVSWGGYGPLPGSCRSRHGRGRAWVGAAANCACTRGGTEYCSILRTVSLCSPNTRAASRGLIPSTIQALRTRTYSSTLYILHTFHRVVPNSMEGGGWYGFAPPHHGAVTRLRGPLSIRRLHRGLLRIRFSTLATAGRHGDDREASPLF